MWSAWQKHLIVCLFLGLLIIPVYFLDKAAMEGGGGNWITFDFRGLIFWSYVVLLAIDIVVSSIGVLLFPSWKTLRIHVASIVLSTILLVTGFIIYGKLLRAQSISHCGNISGFLGALPPLHVVESSSTKADVLAGR